MDNRDCQYTLITGQLSPQTELDEFVQRLESSSIGANPYYLGLLLMTIVGNPSPRPDFVRYLLQKGANVNFAEPEGQRTGRTALMMACEKSVSANVRALIEWPGIQLGQVDSGGNTALMYAIGNQNEWEGQKMAQFLIQKDAELISKNNNADSSPLSVACLQAKTKIASLLLREGADPNQKIGTAGTTVLHMVIGASGQLSQNCQRDLISLLFYHGADPYLQDQLGENGFDYAQKYLFDLEELQEERKTQTEPTQINTKQSESESLFMVTGQEQNIRVLRDFGPEKQENSYSEEESVTSEDSSQEYVTPFQKDERLSADIWQFSLEAHAEYEKAWIKLQPVYNTICEVATALSLRVQLVGSFATGLWTPLSDINIIFINESDEFVDIRQILCQAYKLLLQKSNMKNAQLNDKFKVPSIKMVFEGLTVELGIFQRKSVGKKYVKYIKQCLDFNSMIRPVFFAFHKILDSFGLSRPPTGGLKTYTIFLMICMSWQVYPPSCLAEGLRNFIYYFSEVFEFQVELEEQGNWKCLRRKLSIIDPLNELNNVGGRKTKVEELIELFNLLACIFRDLPNSHILDHLFSAANMIY